MIGISSEVEMIYNRDNPFPAKLKSRTRITSSKSDKNVQHLVFDISGSGMTYKCGDSIAIFPRNNIVEVAEILNILKIQPETEVQLQSLGRKVSIFSALYEHLCITNLSRQFLAWFVSFVSDLDEALYVDSKMLCDEQECKLVAKSHSLLEILKKFKNIRKITANELVFNLKRLTPRLYSIASSPLVCPTDVHIVVNVVSYVNFVGNKRHGIASSYLANDMNIGSDTANVFIVNSMFSMPSDEAANIIMVGPGTGVAPFRGFLQERQFKHSSGCEVGKSWLFFGDRNYETDFLFKDEFLNLKDDGILTNMHLAFSRDQEKKVYVQDRIWENRDELWAWVLDGAYIYVCGNASSMAADVEDVLKKVAIDVGGFDEIRAAEFFKDLRKNRRYQKDVY